MEAMLAWGADTIVWLQQLRTPALDAFFETLTWFGGVGYLYLIPLAVWCLDYRLGSRLVLLFALTALVNFLIKDLIALPRPYAVDVRIVSDGEFGWSLPSGHAQLAVAYWGVLAAWFRRRWFWALALTIIVLMGFSRIYLGVHYPSDVLAGWLLGGAMLWLWLSHHGELACRLEALGLARQFLALTIAVLGLLALCSLSGAGALPYGAVGFLLGAGLGVALMVRGGARMDPGPWWLRVAGFAIAMSLTLGLVGALARVVSASGLGNAPAAFIAMVVMALWLLWVVPWLWRRLAVAGAKLTV